MSPSRQLLAPSCLNRAGGTSPKTSPWLISNPKCRILSDGGTTAEPEWGWYTNNDAWWVISLEAFLYIFLSITISCSAILVITVVWRTSSLHSTPGFLMVSGRRAPLRSCGHYYAHYLCDTLHVNPLLHSVATWQQTDAFWRKLPTRYQ